MVDTLLGVGVGLVLATIAAEFRVRRARREAASYESAMFEMFENTERAFREIGLEDHIRATAILLEE
jgi:hypothetical protein